MTRSGTLHPQDGHAMEPRCCHCLPTATGDTDRLELKLVPFVAPTDASKHILLAPVDHIDHKRFNKGMADV